MAKRAVCIMSGGMDSTLAAYMLNPGSTPGKIQIYFLKRHFFYSLSHLFFINFHIICTITGPRRSRCKNWGVKNHIFLNKPIQYIWLLSYFVPATPVHCIDVRYANKITFYYSTLFQSILYPILGRNSVLFHCSMIMRKKLKIVTFQTSDIEE